MKLNCNWQIPKCDWLGYNLCGHKLVAKQIWVLVQARPHLLAETLCRKMTVLGLKVAGKALINVVS